MIRCAYCHDDCIAEVVCDCRAIYHEACAVELRKCATLGCRVVLAVPSERVWVGAPEPVYRLFNPFRYVFSILHWAYILAKPLALYTPPSSSKPEVDQRLLTQRILDARTPKDIADLL